MKNWFNATPEIVKVPVMTYQLVWKCPTDGCLGEMESRASDSLTFRDGYEHVCVKCGHSAWLSSDWYPRIVHERAEAMDAVKSDVAAGPRPSRTLAEAVVLAAQREGVPVKTVSLSVTNDRTMSLDAE